MFALGILRRASCAEPPGQRHIYHTTDTFILASAMQNYLQRSSLNSTNASSTAEITDVWELIAEEILKPLDISSTAFTSLRTYDARAQPYGGASHHEPAAENVARGLRLLRVQATASSSNATTWPSSANGRWWATG